HVGLGVWILGVAFTTNFSVERDVRMNPDTPVTMAGYQFTLSGVHHAEGPNYSAERGTVYITKDGRQVAVLHPETRFYPAAQETQTIASVKVGVLRDLYVSLGDKFDGGAWGMRMYFKPMIREIWYGGLLMFIGGGLAATDKRYRLARVARRARVPGPDGAAAQPVGA
ncbi:MAG TPA: cytochrome c-type biogenesis CcmF C-terminal domain-containing protein, partial [Nevskiaceae bacterium]